MGVLNVESGGLHGSEHGFNLPALLIRENCAFRPVKADEYLQFRHTIGVFNPAACKIDVFSLMEERFVVELFLSDLQVIEEPPGADSLTGGRRDDPEVLSDPDIVTYSMFIGPSNPFLSDELPVCDKAVNAVGSAQSHEPFQDFPSFVPIGAAPLWKQAENQRKRYPFIGYSLHKDVDVERSDLPVGTVHAQHKTDLDRQQKNGYSKFEVESSAFLSEKKKLIS